MFCYSTTEIVTFVTCTLSSATLVCKPKLGTLYPAVNSRVTVLPLDDAFPVPNSPGSEGVLDTLPEKVIVIVYLVPAVMLPRLIVDTLVH